MQDCILCPSGPSRVRMVVKIWALLAMDNLCPDIFAIVTLHLDAHSVLSMSAVSRAVRKDILDALITTYWTERADYYDCMGISVDASCVGRVALRDLTRYCLPWGGGEHAGWIDGIRRCPKFYAPPLHSWGRWELPSVCTARTRRGSRCMRRAAAASLVCTQHLKATP